MTNILKKIVTSFTGDDAFGTPDIIKNADSDMAKVLESLQKLGPKPLETLTAVEARQQPTPADAVDALLREQGKNPEQLKAGLGVKTWDITYNEGLPMRIYKPADAKITENLPVILYFHGGGWVIADIDVYDAAPRALAKKARALVISAEYLRAPENKFPAAHEDAFIAYQWTIANAAKFGGDPSQIAVMGESAGGNLAINVAMAARDRGIQLPVHMALIYPVAGVDMTTESYRKNAQAKPLNKPMMEWFVKNVLEPKDRNDPRIDLVNANLVGLPPATIITAEIDPLQSEGELLAFRLKKAGVETSYKNYEGVTHEFFGMDAVVSKARSAQSYVVDSLNAAFD